MKNKNIIKSNEDFQSILNQKKNIQNELFKIYYQKNIENIFQFGIAVGKKRVKSAVKRNKIKRWTREVIHKNNFNDIGYKIIIIVIASIDNIEFKVFEEKLSNLIFKLRG